MKTLKNTRIQHILLITVLLLSGLLPAAAEGLGFVPHSSKIYLLLEQAWAGGYLDYLPQVRPYTTAQVQELAAELDASSAPAALKQALRANLAAEAPGLNLASSWDEGSNSLRLNTRAGLSFDMDLSNPQDLVAKGSWIVDLGIGFGDYLFLGVGQNFSLSYYSWLDQPFNRFDRPAMPDMNMYTFFLDKDSQGFNHVMSHTPGDRDISITAAATMQFNIGLPFGHIQVGRQSLDWGPSPFANLALSKTSKPYEYFGYSFDIAGKGRFIWTTNVLQPFGFTTEQDPKLISAHRLEYQFFPWFMFAIQESIVYSYRFELSYMNPLTLYYISEVNKGDQDNKLGGVDLIFRAPDTKIYLSLYADDWDFGQLFSFNYFHNIWAGILGATNYSVPGLVLNAEAIYLSHWMYTHDIENQQYTHWGTHLGHPLDPTSWMLRLKADYSIQPQWQAGLNAWVSQKGRGNINTPALWGEEAVFYGVPLNELFYRFLDSGMPGIVIETSWSIGLNTEYTLPRLPISFAGSWQLQRTLNKGNIEGSHAWNNYFSLVIRM
ncbi:MAG: capsule assembly Wzi family protein [Spirochaetes bacterium]|nr:capsule assembly Wzi family protein [Spirochaetota bacterium]MBU0953895.1 capsule assembly Wzi family protein [Spirochaetota bacterium]